MAIDSSTLPDLDNEDSELVVETPPPQVESKNSPRQSKIIRILLVAAGTILLTAAAGFLYRLARPASPDDSSSPAPSALPSPSPASLDEGQSKTLRLGGLSFEYPADWLVIFSPLVDNQNPLSKTVYFARNLDEYRRFASCAITGSCTTAPLQLSYSDRVSIWTGYSLPDFLRETAPAIPLDKLSEGQLGGLPARRGYTDLSELNYQILFQPTGSTYQSLTVTARTDTGDMAATLLSSLDQLKLLPDNSERDPAKLTPPRAYTLSLKSRLPTGDFWVLQSVLENLLAPSDPGLNPHYLLYVEGTSAYPTTNILENTYYLLTDNPDLAPDKYALAQLDATVGDPPVEGLVSYLQDPKYCRESSDCLYRANFCEIDAFNRYHQYFTPWGCGPATYVGLGDSLSLEESLGCASNESVEVKPDSLECRESRCVAVNPVPSCVRNP